MKAIVLDLETSRECRLQEDDEFFVPTGQLRNGRWSNEASPFHDGNKIVMTGIKHLSPHSYNIIEGKPKEKIKDTHIIGQNLAFDIKWLLNYNLIDLSTCSIWDIQLAEYYLTGQQTMFADLDSMAIKYGGSVKNDLIKKHWDEGGRTEDIPTPMLKTYLKDDLINTYIVRNKQFELAKERGKHFLNLLKNMMGSRVLTILMEYNGLNTDRETFTKHRNSIMSEVRQVEDRIISALKHHLPKKDPLKISSQNLSLVIFGGEYEYRERVHKHDEDGNPLYFKSNGNPKLVFQKFKSKVKGLDTAPSWLQRGKNVKTYNLNEQTIEDLIPELNDQNAISLLKDMLEYRGLQKELSTYFLSEDGKKGWGTHIWPNDLIHANINHASTVTGRVASSNPNILNIP